MASLIYLDNSNFWLSASSMMAQHHTGFVPMPDYKHLVKLLSMGEAPKVAKAYGSKGHNQYDWNHLKQAGFETALFKRDADNTEKEVDTALVTDMVTDGLTIHEPGDIMVLIAGDRDYVPAIKRLKQAGVDVYVAFWSNRNSECLQSAATRFVCLDNHFKDLCKPRTSRNYWRTARTTPAIKEARTA